MVTVALAAVVFELALALALARLLALARDALD
jgi:hypothetical protein